MTKIEMFRRLATVNEAKRLEMFRMARDGESGFAVAGYDRANMKVSNAVFVWLDTYKNILPTDSAITP